MQPPINALRTWTRQPTEDSKSHSRTTYTISTDPSLIQLDALNAAFQSDMLYWAQPLPLETLRLCVERSLCFGLYAHGGKPQATTDSIPQSQETPCLPPCLSTYLPILLHNSFYLVFCNESEALTRNR